MRAIAKVSFSYHRSINMGDVIEMTDIEYSRLKHLVELSEEVNTQDSKPNKQYKKGRRKNK